MPAMFQRRHYEAIAGILRRCEPDCVTQPYACRAWRDTVNNFTLELLSDNPRFDRARFEKACGYGDAPARDEEDCSRVVADDDDIPF
jgi:hypothetical protein